MKKIVLFLSLSFYGLGCSESVVKKETPQNTKADNNATKMPLIGGDKDSHGCIASAGYQWSVVRNECIRIFELGIRLNAKGVGIDTTFSAFAVFNSNADSAQAELFLVNVKRTVILNRGGYSNFHVWKNNDYTLTAANGVYSLGDAKNTLLYQSR